MESENKGSKLKSRTFWATVITAAYFALMAMKEEGVNNTVTTIVFGALTAFVVFGYVVMEKWLDADRLYEGSEESGIEDEGGDPEEIEEVG